MKEQVEDWYHRHFNIYAKAFVQSGSWYRSWYLVHPGKGGPLGRKRVLDLVWRRGCRLEYSTSKRKMSALENVLDRFNDPMPGTNPPEEIVDMIQEVRFTYAALTVSGITLVDSENPSIGNVAFINQHAGILAKYHRSLVRRLTAAASAPTRIAHQLSVPVRLSRSMAPAPRQRSDIKYAQIVGCYRKETVPGDGTGFVLYLMRGMPAIAHQQQPEATQYTYEYNWVHEEGLMSDENTELYPIEYSFFAINHYGVRLVKETGMPRMVVSFLDIPEIDAKGIEQAIALLKRVTGL